EVNIQRPLTFLFDFSRLTVFFLKKNPRGYTKALKDPSWIEAMHEELLQFKMQNVWVLVDLPRGLQVKQKQDRIFISQDKYVAAILRKFGLTDRKSANTLIDTKKPLLKDPNGEDMNVHIYRSMIGSLMYLTSSRPDIMFAVCACVRFQVTPKASHLHAVKRIFRYLKGKLHLGLWYHKDSPFDLVAYSDSDYARASLDRKSTTGGCQFLVDEKDRIKVSVVDLKLLLSGKFLMLSGYSLFDGMLVQPQVQDVEDVVEDEAADNEICATLTKQVANLEQDKIAQAIEIIKLKQRVRRLEKKRQHKSLGGKIAALDANEDVTLEAIDAEVVMDADDSDEAEPAKVEEVIEVVTAAKLIKKTATASVIVHSEVKSKDKGKGILDEEPKPLKRQAQIKHDEAFARQLGAELNANINWNDVVDQVKRKEKQDNTVMRYQALKRKPITEAQT
nr:hypothetical protein [Tanacetum cinerariifolium]